MKQNKQLRDTEEKTFEGSGPLPRTKTASNSCYKAASFAQAEPSSHEGNRRASPGAQVLNSGCDTEPRGVLQKPRGFYARAQPRAAALTSGSLASPVGWKGRCRPRHSAVRAAWRQQRGEKGGKSTGFLYCSAGLCSLSPASTLCIFRQGKPLVISLSSQWLNPHKIAGK